MKTMKKKAKKIPTTAPIRGLEPSDSEEEPSKNKKEKEPE